MHPFATKLTGAALVVAPALLLLATIAFAVGGDGMNNSEVAGAIMPWAMVAFAVGLLGLARRLEDTAPRGAPLLGVLVLVGCVGGVGFGIDAMHAALTGGVNLLDTDGALVPLGLAIPGALFPVSIIVTGIAAGRARVVGRWSAALIVVGAALFPASRVPSIPALSILADVVLLVGLASAGLALLAAAPRTGTAATQPG